MTEHTKEPFDWSKVPIAKSVHFECKAEITQLRKDKAELVKAAVKVLSYKGGCNLMGNELCPVCSRAASLPTIGHGAACPIPTLKAAIAKHGKGA